MVRKLITKHLKKNIARYYPDLQDEIRSAQKAQTENHWKDRCALVAEIGGVNYYKFNSGGDIPIVRFEKMQIHVMELDARLSKREFDLLTDICTSSLDKAINTAKQSGRIADLQSAQWAIVEMKSRRENLMFHPEIMLELAALQLIRQDENPFEISEAIHKEKIALFRERGGSEDFFIRAGWMDYLPNWQELISAWTERWEAHVNLVKLSDEAYPKILTEVKSTLG